MDFRFWLSVNEEINNDNTAIVYHRLTSMTGVRSLLTNVYMVGGRTDLGRGLYTTMTLEGQFSIHMEDFGDFLTKWEVKGLDRYMVFGKDLSMKIHGDDWSLFGQMSKLNILDKFKDNSVKLLGSPQQIKCMTCGYKNVVNSKECVSCFSEFKIWEINLSYFEESNLLNRVDFLRSNHMWLENSVRGCIYPESRYGIVLLKYLPIEDGTISLVGYVEAAWNDVAKMSELKRGVGWNSEIGGTSMRDIYHGSEDMKERHRFRLPSLTITPDGFSSYVVRKSPFTLGFYRDVKEQNLNWTKDVQTAIGAKADGKIEIDRAFIFSYDNGWYLTFKKENWSKTYGVGTMREGLYEFPTLDGRLVDGKVKIENGSNLCFRKKKEGGSLCFRMGISS